MKNLAYSTDFTIVRILVHTGTMFTDGAEKSRNIPSTRTTFGTVFTISAVHAGKESTSDEWHYKL